MITVASTSVARADCPAIDGASEALLEVPDEARLSFIRAELAADASAATAWEWGWGGSFAGLTVAQLVLVPILHTRDTRIDLYNGAASTFIGLLPLVLLPLRSMGDHRRLEEEITNRTEDVSTCTLLASAERYLLRDAEGEAFGTSALAHIVNVALGVGAAVVLGFGYDHWTSAILRGTVGVAVGEALILTQPRGAVRALDRYRLGEVGAAAVARIDWSVAPMLGANFAGASFSMTL